MSPTLRWTISQDTVLLLESGWDILLYESPQLYRNVADPPADDFPEHRITLRVGMRHPALRVTANDLLFLEITGFFLFFWKIHGKIRKFTFSRFFENDHFFGSDVKLSFSISPSIKSIDTLFLPHGLSFEIFPFRKWSQIKIWTYKTFSIFNFKTLTS